MSNMKVKDADQNDVYLKASGTGTDLDPYITVHDLNDAGPTNLPVYQFADTNGDGTGTYEMNVDGSVTPVEFYIAPPTGTVYRIARLIVSVRDTGSFDSGGWGNNGGDPLDNGLEAKVTWNTVEVPLTINPIKSHFDLAALSFDITHNNWGAGDEFIVFRFTFTKAGQYIRLDGDYGDKLSFYVNDDLTYLVEQKISVQGYTE